MPTHVLIKVFYSTWCKVNIQIPVYVAIIFVVNVKNSTYTYILDDFVDLDELSNDLGDLNENAVFPIQESHESDELVSDKKTVQYQL